MIGERIKTNVFAYILMSLEHRAEGLSYGQNHDGKTNASMFTTKEYRFEELQAKPMRRESRKPQNKFSKNGSNAA